MKKHLPALIFLPLGICLGIAAWSYVKSTRNPKALPGANSPVVASGNSPRQALDRCPRTEPVVCPDPLRATASISPLPPTPPSTALPAPPASALEHPEELQHWLLALPSADVSRLAGTAQMDGYVSLIVSHLESVDDLEERRVADIDRFLMLINAEILRADSDR
ncbi:MAG: hypothetical protein HYY18_10775 [Planctomycetes bacterium]|nr:hypothetical protein [Planctomycetota bacterium]